MAVTLQTHFFESSRGRILGALRLAPATADELASSLGHTKHAIRAQLRSMDRDGLIESAGFRPGTTRPFVVYRLTAEVEQLLSRAYAPFLSRLVQVFASRQTADEFETVMRQTGRALAHDFERKLDGAAGFPERLAAASELLNQELGALTYVERDAHGFTVRGAGCPLSALTGKNPGACLAIESLLAQCLDTAVRECCDRSERPRCCFRIERLDD